MINLSNFKKAIYNLDTILSIIGVFVALILIVASLFKHNPMYIVAGILLLSVCMIYLYIGESKEFTISYISQIQTQRSVYLLLNILFLLTFCYSILSLYLRSNLYIRPSSYFISIILMVSIIAVEILFSPRDKLYANFVLLKIISIPLSLVWSQSLMFTTVIGDDPFWHQVFTQRILDLGFIPGSHGYAKLPVFHLMSGVTTLITGLDYKIATMFSISSMQIICLLSFTYLLGKFIFNAKVGLLAALLLGISNVVIRMSYWTIPQTFSAILILIVLYLLFKIKQDKPLISSSLSILLMVTLILTHTIGSMCMAILLFAFWAGEVVSKGVQSLRQKTVVTFSIAVLFVVTMIAWWVYASEHITTFVELIKWGFKLDFWTQYSTIYEGIAQYTYDLPFGEELYNSIGFYLFVCLSLPGCFYMLSRGVKNVHGFNLAIGSMGILGIIFVASLFHYQILITRWHYFCYILLSISVAVTLILFAGRVKNNRKKALYVVFVIATLSFLMIMTPLANMDNPLFNDNVIRKANIDSELQATETILELTSRNITIDNGLVGHLKYNLQFPNDMIFSMQESLYTKDFSDYRDFVIIIRKEISQSAIVAGGGSVVRLDYAPAQLLTDKGFSHIYECGSVSAFYE